MALTLVINTNLSEEADMNNDKEVLLFLHARLQHVYGENPNVDYMKRLHKIALSHEETDTEQLACPMVADQDACHNIKGFTDDCGCPWGILLTDCENQPNKADCWKRFHKIDLSRDKAQEKMKADFYNEHAKNQYIG